MGRENELEAAGADAAADEARAKAKPIRHDFVKKVKADGGAPEGARTAQPGLIKSSFRLMKDCIWNGKFYRKGAVILASEGEIRDYFESVEDAGDKEGKAK